MKKVALADIIMASRDSIGLAKILPSIIESNNVFEIKDAAKAYQNIGAPIPEKSPNEVLKSQFPDDEPAFIIQAKRAVIIYSATGNSVEHFYGSNKKLLEIDQDYDKTTSRLFTILSRLNKEHQLSTPEGIINNDHKLRTKDVERARFTRVQSINKVPEDFWSAIEFIAKWSTCFEEFEAVIDNNSCILDSSNRNLGRIARATMALDCLRKPSDEEITIYRASAHSEDIGEGDWVTIHESYAAGHLDKNLMSQGTIHEVEVSMDEVFDTSSAEEQVYIPRSTWRGHETLEDVYNSVLRENKPRNYPAIGMRTIEEIQRDSESSMGY